MVTQITKYVTQDGTEFSSMEEAEKHEHWFNVTQQIQELIDRQIGRHSTRGDEIFTFIEQNMATLHKILGDYYWPQED